MTEKPRSRSVLHLVLLITVVLAGLSLASFIGGSVGRIMFGGEAVPIFSVDAPHPKLPAERPFHGVPITNTLITSWISIVLLLGIFIGASRRLQTVPRGLQNFVEFFYESAAGFIEDTAGKEYGRKFFPVCFTIFLFVLGNAWISLIPGFETLKVNDEPLLRNANTDINVPLMLAVISFLFVEYWGFKAHGFSYLKKFFNVFPLLRGFKLLFSRQVKAGLGGILNGTIAVFTGVLEVISELVRVVSFTFRLFGNMTAGMILVMIIIFLVPWVVPSLFYGLEAFFGFVQAMIFGGLTLCFLMVAVMSHEEENVSH